MLSQSALGEMEKNNKFLDIFAGMTVSATEISLGQKEST
jgi:hypothetical protein